MSAEKDRSRPGEKAAWNVTDGDKSSVPSQVADSVGTRELTDFRDLSGGKGLPPVVGSASGVNLVNTLSAVPGGSAPHGAGVTGVTAGQLLPEVTVEPPAVTPVTHSCLADIDAQAELLRGVFVLRVQVNDEGDRRTYFYKSAGAAERAVKRARERGRTAHVALCQLVPVGVVWGPGGLR